MEEKKYAVYKNGRFEGSTQAISEEQAINFVRHRKYGESESQYENQWEAVCITDLESEKAKQNHEQKMKEAIERMKKVWLPIPDGADVKSYHPPCEFYPMIEGEPDLISRGEINGRQYDLGFFRGDSEPKLYRKIPDVVIDDPQEQIDIFSF